MQITIDWNDRSVAGEQLLHARHDLRNCQQRTSTTASVPDSFCRPREAFFFVKVMMAESGTPVLDFAKILSFLMMAGSVMVILLPWKLTASGPATTAAARDFRRGPFLPAALFADFRVVFLLAFLAVMISPFMIEATTEHSHELH